MRHARLLPVAIICAAWVAACTTASAGWTYVPAPSVSPAASSSASAAPSGTTNPDLVTISALGLKFEQTAVTVPASTPFQIVFENKDPSTPHNIAIHQGGPTGPELFKGTVFNGVETRTYSVPALDPGAYSFVCTVHPTMVGTLTSQ